MRVAVCLSGHSRNYRHNAPNVPFACDYFISTYNESGLCDDPVNDYISYHYKGDIKTKLIDKKHLLNTYKPKFYHIELESDIPKELMKYVNLKTKSGYYLKHIGMMFYNIYVSNFLKKQYEYQNNFKYDFVVRSRFDVLVNEFDFNVNNLYLNVKNDKTVLDLFFAGSSYIIDAISDCYIWFIHQDPEFLMEFKSAEEIFYYYINTLNLNVPFLNNFDITFNKDYAIETLQIKNGVEFMHKQS